jgi:hypothetical protein
MIYKFICFSLADTQNSEFKGDPRHKGEIILGFGNGSVRTKAAISGYKVTGNYIRHEAAVDIKRNAWEYTENNVQHITIFEPAT